MKYKIIHCTKHDKSWYVIEQKGRHFLDSWSLVCTPTVEGNFDVKKFTTEEEAEKYILDYLAPFNAPTKETTVKILKFN